MDGQDMTDYTKLVEALRHCNGPSWLTCQICQYNNDMMTCAYKMLRDAAAAIEELLPKRGKWIYKPKDAIEMMFTLPKCSVCGHESSDANNFCPNCGADMRGEQDE